MTVLYCAITNHGFGHATRMASVLSVLQKLRPEYKLIVATTAPEWLLQEYIKLPFIYRPCALDVGVVQSDSLTMDKSATLCKWQALLAHYPEIIDQESAFLRAETVDLVLADIPHLAVSIAHTAGIPCWMFSNFGWDFIYRAWGEQFAVISDWLSSCYAECDQLFRLPFCESMSQFPHIIDAGLTGVHPNFSAEEVRSKLNLAPDKPTILLTFGGLSLQAIPYHNLARFPDYQFISFDQNAPQLTNLTVVNRPWQMRPIDVMQVCDRVVTKPGYCTFAEVYRSHKCLICLTRSDFAEADLLLQGAQDYFHHLIISPEEFYTGDWSFLAMDMHPPKLNQGLAVDGEYTIAHAVIDYLES